MVMVEVVFLLGPPYFPPKYLIVVLMVVVLCHLRVICLQYHFSLEESNNQTYLMI